MNWSVPEEFQYTKEHEWLKSGEEKGVYVVGITDYAQDKLGDVVFVELPEAGHAVAIGESLAVVESVKAVVDVYSPVSGEIVHVNNELLDKPELLNEDPYGKGWIAAIKTGEPMQAVEFISSQEYARFIAEKEDS